MNKNIFLIVLLFLVSGRIAAQSVTVDAKIDSLQILIGEQAKVQLQVAMDVKQKAVFPVFTDTLVRGVVCVESKIVWHSLKKEGYPPLFDNGNGYFSSERLLLSGQMVIEIFSFIFI